MRPSWTRERSAAADGSRGGWFSRRLWGWCWRMAPRRAGACSRASSCHSESSRMDLNIEAIHLYFKVQDLQLHDDLHAEGLGQHDEGQRPRLHQARTPEISESCCPPETGAWRATSRPWPAIGSSATPPSPSTRCTARRASPWPTGSSHCRSPMARTSGCI